MRKRVLTLSAILALALPAAASGQEGALVTASDRPGIGTLMSALDGLEGEVHELQSLGHLTPADIRLVGIGSALAGDEIATFRDALSRNRSEIVEMRKFLTTADVAVIGDDAERIPLRNYLGDAGIGVSDVMVLNVTGGTLTVFVEDALQVRIVEPLR